MIAGGHEDIAIGISKGIVRRRQRQRILEGRIDEGVIAPVGCTSCANRPGVSSTTARRLNRQYGQQTARPRGAGQLLLGNDLGALMSR
jgi:hypothetical protein